MTEALSLENVTAGYSGAPVLRGLALSVGEGEVVALLGANGAGKTTALRVISGAMAPMSGRIAFDGKDIAGKSATGIARLGIAHVPDDRGIFFGLTVSEHFRLGYRGENLDLEVAHNYFPALRSLSERRAGLLSGGEQQMLALGRAMARSPRLLLVDELSQGLAPVIVEKLLPTLRDYAEATGAGVLLVEQHVQLALGVADRAYVLSRGEVVLEGETESLSDDHDLILASYLGEDAGKLGE